MNNYTEKLGKMIGVNTVSVFGVKNPEKFAKYREVLKELFPKIFETFNIEIIEDNLLLSYVVKTNKKPILLMSHQDVVEANGTWDSDPFTPTVKNERLYGRGTIDTKGNFFAICQAIEELLDENYKFPCSVYIFSSCNEEVDQTGAMLISDILVKRNVEFDFVLDEGGLIIDNPFGKSSKKAAMVGLGEKACVEVKFYCKGKGGHASSPRKDNPLRVLSEFIIDVEKHNKFVYELPYTTAVALEKVAPTLESKFMRFLFSKASKIKFLICSILKRVSPITKSLVCSTICFTKIHGSEANNVIPEEAYAIANMRVSHKEGLDSAKAKIEKIAKKYDLEIEYLDEGYYSPVCDCNNKQFSFLEKHIHNTFHNVVVAPYIASSSSDSKVMHKVSENVFRFAPFSVSADQLNSVHSINENIDITSINTAVKFYKTLIKDIKNEQ